MYEEMPGWEEDITGCGAFEDLPKNARDYIQFIEDLADVPVAMIAVGPSRVLDSVDTRSVKIGRNRLAAILRSRRRFCCATMPSTADWTVGSSSHR